MKRFFFSLVVLFVFAAPVAGDQHERPFCTLENCAVETFRIVFSAPADVATGSSQLKLAEPTLNKEFPMCVVVDNKTAKVQGWSMGVAHNPEDLELLEVTTEGLTLPAEFFSTTTPSVPEVEGDPPPGFVSAYVAAIFPPPGEELQIADNVCLVRARYKVIKELTACTKLEFVNNLVPNKGSPPTAVNMTIEQQSRPPTSVIDGEVCPDVPVGGCDGVAEYGYYFGPTPTTDTYVITGDSFAISMRNKTASLGFSLGVQITGNDFKLVSEVVGTDEDRKIELIITDDKGDSQDPSNGLVVGNAATAARPDKSIGKIERGAGLAGTENDSFLAVDLNPGVGGPGFTIGFVADISGVGNVIDPTADADPCPVNEILIVTFVTVVPAENFSRGDCNGDGKINVTDGVLCAQNIFLNKLIKFDCDDMLDANDDGTLDAADPIAILEWVFLNGSNLPAPFRSCAADPTDDTLKCAAANCGP